MATSMLKVSTSSQKMATSMLKVASDIYKMPLYRIPTPLRTSQTSGHSSFRVSNLPLWSLKSPPSHGSKIIIFHLSQSKCTVSAHFLHTGGKAVFFLALSAFCASWRNLSGQSPSILLRKTAPSLKSPTGAFIAALRLQTRIFLPPPRYTVQKRPPHKALCGGLKI